MAPPIEHGNGGRVDVIVTNTCNKPTESIDKSTSETKLTPPGTTTDGEVIDKSKENPRHDAPKDLGTIVAADSDKTPQTGDDSSMNLFLVLIMLAAAAALISIAPAIKKQFTK